MLRIFRKKHDVPSIKVSHLVTSGTTVTLHSDISSPSPLSSVSWICSSPRGDISVDVNGSKYSGATVDSPSLVIRNVSTMDAGTYTCCATNRRGTGQSSPVFIRADDDGILVLSMIQTTHTATEGETVILQCFVTSQPPAKHIWWEKNGENLIIDNMKYIGGSLASPSLAITKTKRSDEGEYFCNAENASKRAKSQKVTLEISNGKSNVNYVSVTEQDEDRKELEEVEKSIWKVYIDMVSDLSKFFTPNLKKTWEDLRLRLFGYMKHDEASIYGDDVTDFRVLCKNMLSQGVITDRRYDVLYDVVRSIDVRPAEIIEKASSKIRKLEGGGMPDTKSVTFIVPVGGDIDNLSFDSTVHIQDIVAKELNIPRNRVKVEFSKKGLVIISFEFCGANTRVEPSALYIATKLKEGLKHGRIQMKDESNSSLPLRPNDGVIYTVDKTKDKTGATVNKADVSICYGKYVKAEGQNAVLDCVVSASPEATNVTWFRIVHGAEVTIQIDNRKYIGASVNTPSLTIADLTKEDQGTYYCKVDNSMGVAESNTAMLHVTPDESRRTRITRECLRKVRESLDKYLRVSAETEQMCGKMYWIGSAQQEQLDHKLVGYVGGSVCVALLWLYLPLAVPVSGFAIGVAFATSGIMRYQIIKKFKDKESLLKSLSEDLKTEIPEFTQSLAEMEIGENTLLSDHTLRDIFSELSTEISDYHDTYNGSRSDANMYLDMLQGLQKISGLLKSCMEQLERWETGYGERLASDDIYR